MAYDAKDGYVLLFGGTYTGFSFNDTWKFVGGVWTNITTSVHPPGGGQNGQMTYDATDGYVVDFCGSVAWGLPPVNVTWDFVGGVWTNITTTHSPPTRWDAAMTFDPKTGYVLLFGGTTNPPTYNDTWKFVGGVWTYLS